MRKEMIDKAIENNPDFPFAYYKRGYCKMKLRDKDQAIADFTKAIELNPGYMLAYLNRGNIYFEKKDYETAVHDFTYAIQLD